MAMESLSSSLTFFYKFVFTTIWTGRFGFGTVAMFMSDGPEVREFRWLFAVAWLVGSALIWRTCGRFKRVELLGSTLVISNYLEDIRVRVDEIDNVRQNTLINLRPVTITFKEPTKFGRSVTFMPPVSFRMFSEDKIVTRLRNLAVSGGEAPV